MTPRIDRRHARWLYLSFIIVVAYAFMTLTACVVDGGESVRIQNRTDQTVAVLEDGTEIHRLAPGDEGDFAVLKFEGARAFEVRTLDGVVLASRTFTWEEITEADGITIVVE